MNIDIVKIIESLKNSNSDIEIYCTINDEIYYLSEIGKYVSPFDGSEYVKLSNEDYNIFFNTDGKVVINSDKLPSGKVSVGCECVIYPIKNGIKQDWKDYELEMPEPNKYYINSDSGSVFYIYGDKVDVKNKPVRHILNIMGSSRLYGTSDIDFVLKYIDDSEQINIFNNKLLDNLNFGHILVPILKKYSIISLYLTLDKSDIVIHLDLISDRDELNVNNAVNYYIKVPIDSFYAYTFNINDLKPWKD